jgi:O-antigen ligase
VGYFLMPAALKDRFVTTFSGEYLTASGELQATALASKEQRLMLLEHSLLLTFTHPLFGVGPGQFQVASSQEPEQQGIAWRETHNAFTQVSSETGLPGFLLYVAALWYCFGITGALARASRAPGLEDLGAMAYCMRLSLVCFTVTSMFSSVAYAFYFPTLAGLTVALDAVGQREILARAAQASVPEPPMAPPPATTPAVVSPVRHPSPGLASKPKGLRPAG